MTLFGTNKCYDKTRQLDQSIEIRKPSPMKKYCLRVIVDLSLVIKGCGDRIKRRLSAAAEAPMEERR